MGVDLLREGFVDDVDVVEVLVLAPEPGVDPEGGDAHDLLLLVAHAPAHVHAQDDHRVRLRHLPHVPRAVAAVLADGDDDGVLRIVLAGRDLALQGLAERALEVAQRLRADLADVRVLQLLDRDRAPAARHDARQLQLFAQDRRQLFEAHLHLEDVLARLGPRLRLERLARLALTLTHAAHFLLAKTEPGDLDLREGYGDDVLALPADQLALGQVLPEFLLDDAADDLPESLHVTVDLPEHRGHRSARVYRLGTRVRDFDGADKVDVECKFLRPG